MKAAASHNVNKLLMRVSSRPQLRIEWLRRPSAEISNSHHKLIPNSAGTRVADDVALAASAWLLRVKVIRRGAISTHRSLGFCLFVVFFLVWFFLHKEKKKC